MAPRAAWPRTGLSHHLPSVAALSWSQTCGSGDGGECVFTAGSSLFSELGLLEAEQGWRRWNDSGLLLGVCRLVVLNVF